MIHCGTTNGANMGAQGVCAAENSFLLSSTHKGRHHLHTCVHTSSSVLFGDLPPSPGTASIFLFPKSTYVDLPLPLVGSFVKIMLNLEKSALLRKFGFSQHRNLIWKM